MTTFGKVTKGNYNDDIDKTKCGCQFTAPENGMLTAISIYLHNFDLGTQVACIYSDNIDTPNALLASVTRTDIPAVEGWYEFTGFNLPIMGGAKYWLALCAGAYTRTWLDVVATCRARRQAASANPPPPSDPFGSGTDYLDIEYSIHATYTPTATQNWTLAITAGAGGSVSPSGTITGALGSTTPTITATPNSGYVFSYWLFDGATQYTQNPISLTINDVASHTLQAVFTVVTPTTVTITVAAGVNGSVSPTGTVILTIGQAYQFVATPNSSYVLDHWDLAGVSQGASNPLVLTADAAMNGQTLTALFMAAPTGPYTFGKTAIGALTGTSGWVMSNHGTYVCKFIAPENGLVSKLTAYVYWGNYPRTLTPIIYSDNNGLPDQLLAVGTAATQTGDGWLDMPITCAVEAGKAYHLGLYMPAGVSVYGAIDPGQAGQANFGGIFLDNPPNPWIQSQAFDYDWSIYATYTPTSPSSLQVSVSPASATLQTNQSQLFTANPFGGTPPYTVSWKDKASGSVIGTGLTYTFSSATAGNYTIFATVTDSTNLTRQSTDVNITVSVPPPSQYTLTINSTPIVGVPVTVEAVP